MNRKNKILTALLLLGLGFTTANAVLGSNSLMQMDVTKASSDTVDFTMYTSDDTNMTPIVRKKSDNKYVVLIPGLSSSAISTPDFHGVKDIITNIDIKSIADTSEGYTKVTVITKKPLNIRTKTVKSAPVTPEQREYRSLLAAANTPKANSINPIRAAEIPTVKTTPAPQPPAKNTIKPDSVTSNIKKFESASKNEVKKAVNKVSDIKDKKDLEKQTPKTEPKNIQNNTSENVQQTTEKNASFVKELQADAAKTENDNNVKNNNENKQEIKTVPVNTNTTKSKTKAHALLSKLKSKSPLIMFIFPILLLMFLVNIMKNSIKKTRNLETLFTPKNSDNDNKSADYTEITDNKELSWREKYSKFNDKSVSTEKNVKTPKLFGSITGNNNDEKRKKLELMLSPIETQTNNIVHSEDDVINSQMKKSIKLKGFAQKPSLKASNREDLNNIIDNNGTINHTGKVQENVNMHTSPLTQNIRRFDEGNLEVSDVDKSKKAAIDAKRREELRKKDYEMSSLDEYFAVIEGKNEQPQTIKMISKPKKQKTTQKEIRKNVENIENQMRVPRAYKLAGGVSLSKAFANPFDKANTGIKMISTPKKETIPSGLTVNSNYEIDKNHGFMMVTLNGKSALIGKANDEIIVLKEFSGIVNKPLQVRKDKENIYLVKTEGFKSLVEVNDSKMGVLIEL